MDSPKEPSTSIPDVRVRVLNKGEADANGAFVLYWMVAFRRTRWNFSLERAIDWARELAKPLVILEGLSCDYRWASPRLHQFIVQGMADNLARLESAPVRYYPYVEPEPRAGSGLLDSLAARACVVVTDDYPAFRLPRMLSAAANRLAVRLEAVDSNGLLPLRAADRVYPTAYAFRRFLQKTLSQHLEDLPRPDPLSGLNLPAAPGLSRYAKRWPPADRASLRSIEPLVRGIPQNADPEPVDLQGGTTAAEATLKRFLGRRLARYSERRNHPDYEVTSELSPYLHFGHIASHEVFHGLAAREKWAPHRSSESATGSRSGWWGMSESAEAFLDQLVTWRELGFNMSWQDDDCERYGSLPAWAQTTLAEHAGDPRPHVYSLEQFESATTHDPLWNAAQTQLLREGRLQNYLRMLWGKKILEWSADPRDALEIMIELNNKYALDGRDPNSTSGIFWILGRYDRAWGPERPIFGKVRYMSSANTARKLRLRGYMERYASES